MDMAYTIVNYKRLKQSRVRKALAYLKYCKGWLVLAAIAAIIMACLQLLLPWMLKVVFDPVTGARSTALAEVVVILAAVGVGIGVCEALKNYAFAQASERILVEIREGLYRRLRALPLVHFQKEQTGI